MIDTIRAKTAGDALATQEQSRLSQVAVPLALLALGAGSAWLYFWGRDLHRFTQWIAAYIYLFIGQLAFYAVAILIVLRWSKNTTRIAKWTTIGLIIFFAGLFRAVLIPQRPYLSADVYRYIWDGRVQTAGINPYRYVPSDPELAGLRDEAIYPNITTEDQRWYSPYPPVAQIVFCLVSLVRPMSVTAFKAAMSSFDLITLLLVMLVLARSGIDPARAIIFAWHPLMIFEGAHSGHIEAVFIAILMLALLAWSREKYVATGISLALATLVKFYPLLVLPAFLISKSNDVDRDPKRLPRSILAGLVNRKNLLILGSFIATVLIVYSPYLSARGHLFGFLRGYIQEEGFVQTGTRYFLLDALRLVASIPTPDFLILAAAGLIWVLIWNLTKIKRSAGDVAAGAIILIGTYLLLTTPRYAWYYAWLVPFLCFSARPAWLYLSCASVLLYLVWYTPFVYPEVPLWVGASIYIPTLAWLIWERLKYGRRENAYEPYTD